MGERLVRQKEATILRCHVLGEGAIGFYQEHCIDYRAANGAVEDIKLKRIPENFITKKALRLAKEFRKNSRTSALMSSKNAGIQYDDYLADITNDTTDPRY